MRNANEREYRAIVEVKKYFENTLEHECHYADEVANLIHNLVYAGSKMFSHTERVAAITVLVLGSFRDYGRNGIVFNLPATADCCAMYKVIEKALKKRKPITVAFNDSVMLDDIIYYPEREGDGLLIDQDRNVHEWRIA